MARKSIFLKKGDTFVNKEGHEYEVTYSANSRNSGVRFIKSGYEVKKHTSW